MNTTKRTRRYIFQGVRHEQFRELLQPHQGCKGNAACRLFNEYEVSRDSGNDYLDISEVVWDNEAAKLIEAMRQNGIERFTFSSGWSHAVETAWLFKEAGCTLEGLVEINSRYTGWNSDEHEKAHGYLFRVEG